MDNNKYKDEENKYSSSESDYEPEEFLQENKYKDEESSSEEEYFSSEIDYESDLEWDPLEDSDIEPEEFKPPIIATHADGIETTFENSYKASEILGIKSADIIKCCKNIRGYKYCTVNDKKYSFREK